VIRAVPKDEWMMKYLRFKDAKQWVQWSIGIVYRTSKRKAAVPRSHGSFASKIEDTLSKLLIYYVLRPTQPPALSEMRNEYLLTDYGVKAKGG